MNFNNVDIDIEAILVYWHLKGNIDIGKYINKHEYYYRTDHTPFGYNMYHNIKSNGYAVYKNKYMYIITPDVKLTDLYYYLVNNEFIKKMSLKFDYLLTKEHDKNCILGVPDIHSIRVIRPI